MHGDHLQLSDGEGRVARKARCALYVALPGSPALQACMAAADGDESASIAAAILAHGRECGPLALIDWSAGVQILAFGELEVRTNQSELAMLSGAGSDTWVERTLRFSDTGLVIEVGLGEALEATALEKGVAAAGGFQLSFQSSGPVETPAGHAGDSIESTIADVRVAESAPERPVEAIVDSDGALDAKAALAAIRGDSLSESSQPNPTAEPQSDGAVDPASTIAYGSEQHEPGVGPEDHEDEYEDDDTMGPEDLLIDQRETHVEALVCPQGHVNVAGTSFCDQCGHLFDAAAAPSVVLRPSLGALLMPDGERLELDDELLLGRNPDRDNDESRQHLRRVPIPADQTVSRVHAAVVFQGVLVYVEDLGARHGTTVMAAGDETAVAVQPGVPQLLEPGSVIRLGTDFRIEYEGPNG